MNAGRIVNMLLRMVLRKAMNRGIDLVVRRGSPQRASRPEEHQQAKQTRQAARLLRRFWRF